MILFVWIIVFITLMFVFGLDAILSDKNKEKQVKLKKANPRIVTKEIDGEMVNVLLT